MNIFKQLGKSIYSPKDIALFRFQGIGKTVLYVFMLSLISVIPTIYYMTTGLNEGIRTAKATISDEFPSFSIENGELQSDKNKPITLNKNGFVILFDSTGTVNRDEILKSNNSFALLKDELLLVAGGQSQSYPYSMLQGSITKDDVIQLIDVLDSSKMIIISLIAIAFYLFTAGISFIEISILALFGLMLKNIADRRIKYGQLWRMAAYSVTLSTVFFTIMTALKTTVPSSFLISWFVSIIVLYLALREIPKPKKAE